MLIDNDANEKEDSNDSTTTDEFLFHTMMTEENWSDYDSDNGFAVVPNDNDSDTDAELVKETMEEKKSNEQNNWHRYTFGNTYGGSHLQGLQWGTKGE